MTPDKLIQARRREHDVMRAAGRKQYAPLGSFVSGAPRTQLLGTLKQLKPQLHTRLRVVERLGEEQRFEVEIETTDLQRRQLIDLWLGIKGALSSAFPAHKPGAVRRLQP